MDILRKFRASFCLTRTSTISNWSKNITAEALFDAGEDLALVGLTL